MVARDRFCVPIPMVFRPLPSLAVSFPTVSGDLIDSCHSRMTCPAGVHSFSVNGRHKVAPHHRSSRAPRFRSRSSCCIFLRQRLNRHTLHSATGRVSSGVLGQLSRIPRIFSVNEMGGARDGRRLEGRAGREVVLFLMQTVGDSSAD